MTPSALPNESNEAPVESSAVIIPISNPQTDESTLTEGAISEDVLIACTEVNKTNIVLQNNNVLEIGVLNNDKDNQGSVGDHSLVINVKENGAEEHGLVNTSSKIQPNDGKIVVKVVGELLKKDNNVVRNVRSAEKLSNSKSNITEMILTSELLLKSPKVTDRKVFKKTSQPNMPQSKVQVFRKTSEPAFASQTKPGKLPVNRKSSHDDTKLSKPNDLASPAQLKTQSLVKSSKLYNSEETLSRKLKTSDDAKKIQSTLSSTSMESLKGMTAKTNDEKDTAVEVWSDTHSIMSEASIDEMDSADKLKKNMSEEEHRNLRRKRIERNISHNNNKGNIVTANISKFQNEIEKLKASRKTSVEKIKLTRTDSKKKDPVDFDKSVGSLSDAKHAVGVNASFERKPSFNTKLLSKPNTARGKVTPRNGPSGQVNLKTLGTWSSLNTLTIEEALLEAESRKNGTQAYKDFGEVLGERKDFGEVLGERKDFGEVLGERKDFGEVMGERKDFGEVLGERENGIPLAAKKEPMERAESMQDSRKDSRELVVNDDENTTSSVNVPAPEAKSEEQLASEKSWLDAEKLWLVHRAGFTLARPLSNARDGKVKVKVEVTGVEVTVDEDDVEKCNPSQYDTCEDLCSLRHLNESSVLHTLRCRYASNLIHTYAGPTSIIINPVAPLAIYSDKVAQMFKGCSSEDMPAHIYSTILTVDKLSAIWVILEAFGSARTCLNINATRVSHIFSLDFDQTGLIASASIQLLLLDKHRVVRRPEGESNFHVLYRLLAGADGTLRKELMLDVITNSGEPNQFIIPYSKHEDTQRGLMDFVRLCAAMSTLNITEVELKCIFSMLAAVLHLGAAGAVKGSNSNKWQFQSPAAAQRAAKCLGVGSDQLARVIFSSPIVSPSSGAGGAGSRQYRTPGSPSSSEELNGQEALESFAANLYSEVFNSVGALINRSLAPSTHTVCSLLLVDTPGFQNPASTGHNQSGASFADFCFNYLQERLGLLFHHSVLVAPRDLYSQENIDIPGLNTPDEAEDDFYSPQSLVSLLDNAPSLSYSGATSTTNDNRKPPGLLWLLDELPGASSGASFPDLVFGNFSEKEYHGLLRKAPGQNHFIVQHNLGTNPVLYNTESWPRVTREPTTSRSVVSLLTESTTPGLSNLVSTHRSAGLGSATFDMGGGGRGVASIRRTTTSLHKRRSVPLQVKFTVDSLIETIRRSELRFVHCLLPHHNAGLVDPRSAGQNVHQFDSLVNIPLLRSQLRGSQLLAAVRLYKQGYPRYMPLTEFRRRFALLGAAPGSSTQPAPSEKGSVVSDDKGAVEEILLSLDLDHSSYRVGLSQIFFRSSVLPQLEAERDKKLSSRVIEFQARCRGYLARKHLAKLKVQDVAVRCIQRNVRKFMDVRDWSWWRLYLKINPLLNVHRTDQELQAKSEELEALKSKLEKLEVERNLLKQDNTRLETKLGEITEDYADEHSTATLATERLTHESSERSRLEKELAEAQVDLFRRTRRHELERRLANLEDMGVATRSAEVETNQRLKKDLKRTKALLKDTQTMLVQSRQDNPNKLLVRQLRNQLEDAEVSRNVATKARQTMESDLADVTVQLEETSRAKSELETRLSAVLRERSQLQSQLDENEEEMTESKQALSLDLSDEGSDATGGEGDLYRKKWERAMRELEFTKHRLTQQHQDDLEQLVGLRKQLEKKLSDAYEQIEEQRNVAAEWKRKVARVNSEMSDQRLLLEEQSSRNTLLEKKQRKFDAEYQMLQDELRQERNQKEKALRDKELALGDKYTMEQTLSSLKLELELKDQKLSSLAQELEELTFSGNTEEEVANLKKKKHALEAKLGDQEEELDELAGQVQMLEQAKLKVEMNLEQVRKAHRKELASKDEELEALRCSTMKKVKALQSQLESEHESRTALLRERHELERRLANLEDMGVATRSAEVETNQRLKKDLKRTKALLKDTQTMLAQSRQDNPNKLLVRQLRNQLEDAEVSRNVATKARQTMESDLADVTVQLEETSRAKSELETRLSAVLRERSQLQSQLDENEEEMTEVLKKYQASVQQLSSEQASLQEATTRISELEAETSSYKDQLAELNSKLESIETHGDPSSTLALKRLQLKCKELESKLEFEHTTRSRLEVQINRLKENTDKLQSECNVLRAKESASSNDVRKLQRTIRELKENIQSLEAKGINDSLKRKELEKEIQCREAEIATLKNELSVASQRIADLQHAVRKLQRTIRELKENIQSLEAKGINDSLKRKELEKEIQCREAEIATLKNELSVASQRIADLQHAIRGDIDDSDSDEDSDNRNSSSLSDERDHTKE
ncbi:unconventional myosin-XVIIIa [Diaphorina citri]|uniref:Unconventional myosin-XVIIIa n=1 Tax=Diaphorina citri TaxID=121845 RepID=A0A3Q0IPC5_DIACI|nr:unconventional myosin-XVIIIa [Diaphorina citri]